MEQELNIGEIFESDNQQVRARGGNQGDAIISSLHGNWYEQNLRGRVYTFGMSNTTLASTNAIATGLTASATPIVGIWNPMNSGVNVEVITAFLHETTLSNTAVATGGYMWVYSAGNGAITTGSNPINCKTLTAPGGSVVKAFAGGTALTGLSNNLAALRAAAFWGINAAGPGTAAPQSQGPGQEWVDGMLIVPPGGVLGIMNQISTTTVACNAGIVWAEVPRSA